MNFGVIFSLRLETHLLWQISDIKDSPGHWADGSRLFNHIFISTSSRFIQLGA